MTVNLDSVFGDDRGEDPEGGAIELTDDLQRVLRLPQREAAEISEAIAEPLSRRLRAPGGTMTLRPLQALALAEAHDLRGLLALLPVGEGKTLVTMLLPVVMAAERPLLLVPAKLQAKTDREFQQLATHWQHHRHYRIESYEMLSRRPDLLDQINPDLIVCDEVHKLKNPKAACTRRVYRYIRSHHPAFVGLSGTIATRSFREWWHLQQWALPPLLQPLPYSYIVMQSWAQALDEKITARRPTGELWRLVDNVAPSASIDQIREAFGRRLRATPGIITADGSSVAASLQIETVDKRIPAIETALDALRATWCTPGGEEFSEASDLWRHAREIANGFYYKWDPEPPEEWMQPRKEFHAFVRSILTGSRTLDTMAQVVAKHPEAKAVVDWYAIKNSFKPNTVPVWLCDDVIEYALAWAEQHRGLVWVEHRAVGERLALKGLPYFGEQGVNANTGMVIDQHRGPAAVSSLAVSEGFNLQAYNTNLVLNVPPMGSRLEQLLGRTHRFGQLADTVTCQMLLTADEQREGFAQARADAAYVQRTTGQRQKLCFADYV